MATVNFMLCEADTHAAIGQGECSLARLLRENETHPGGGWWPLAAIPGPDDDEEVERRCVGQVWLCATPAAPVVAWEQHGDAASAWAPEGFEIGEVAKTEKAKKRTNVSLGVLVGKGSMAALRRGEFREWDGKDLLIPEDTEDNSGSPDDRRRQFYKIRTPPYEGSVEAQLFRKFAQPR